MSDKRSVATDALETLGTIISDNEKRDAIHLAVEPVTAGVTLRPGQDVGIRNGRAYGGTVKHVGIVDPFLKEPVKRGERFWLVVYPREITSLRHVWAHPDFPAVVETVADDQVDSKSRQAKEWIKEYAAQVGLTYNELMEAANDYQLYDDYLNRGELLDGVSTTEEFWDHYALVVKDPDVKRGNFFACSC